MQTIKIPEAPSAVESVLDLRAKQRAERDQQRAQARERDEQQRANQWREYLALVGKGELNTAEQAELLALVEALQIGDSQIQHDAKIVKAAAAANAVAAGDDAELRAARTQAVEKYRQAAAAAEQARAAIRAADVALQRHHQPHDAAVLELAKLAQANPERFNVLGNAPHLLPCPNPVELFQQALASDREAATARPELYLAYCLALGRFDPLAPRERRTPQQRFDKLILERIEAGHDRDAAEAHVRKTFPLLVKWIDDHPYIAPAPAPEPPREPSAAERFEYWVERFMCEDQMPRELAELKARREKPVLWNNLLAHQARGTAHVPGAVA